MLLRDCISEVLLWRAYLKRRKPKRPRKERRLRPPNPNHDPNPDPNPDPIPDPNPNPNPNLEESEAEAAEAGGCISEVARAQMARRVQVALHLVGVRDQSGARAGARARARVGV